MVKLISANYFRLNYIKDLYDRNKATLMVSLCIFLALFLIGLLVGFYSSGFVENLLKHYVKLLHGANIQINTLSIFLHNFQAAALSYLGGIIGIIPFLILSFNGFTYGTFLGYLTHGNMMGSSAVLTPGLFLAYTIPHGIFEFSGFIIASAAGFRLTTVVIDVIKSIVKGKPVNVSYWKLKDSLALFAIATFLIFIAAVIEANFTMTIGNFLMGMFK